MPTIFLAGDSTVAKDQKPFAGWGQMLQPFFKPEIVVANHAKSGRSSKSYIAEKRLETIINEIKPGDYLLVQFGHNDQKPDEDRKTDPFTTYPQTLQIYIDAAHAKGAFPVLITPVYRRRFNENGVQQDTHGEYPNAVRRLAAQKNVPLLDLHKKSGELIAELGVEKSKDIFVHVEPGVYEKHPQGIQDDTHFSKYGAAEIARLVINQIKDSMPELAAYIN